MRGVGRDPRPARVDALERALLVRTAAPARRPTGRRLVTIDKKGEPAPRREEATTAASGVRPARTGVTDHQPDEDGPWRSLKTDALTCSESDDPVLADFGSSRSSRADRENYPRCADVGSHELGLERMPLDERNEETATATNANSDEVVVDGKPIAGVVNARPEARQVYGI